MQEVCFYSGHLSYIEKQMKILPNLCVGAAGARSLSNLLQSLTFALGPRGLFLSVWTEMGCPRGMSGKVRFC